MALAQNNADTAAVRQSGLAITNTTTEPPTPPAEAENAEVAANDTQPTLLDKNLPNNQELLAANNELLVKNAELTRRIDTLTTQVNVLVQERSGQLYIYGAMTAIFCVILGFIFAKLTTKRRW